MRFGRNLLAAVTGIAATVALALVPATPAAAATSIRSYPYDYVNGCSFNTYTSTGYDSYGRPVLGAFTDTWTPYTDSCYTRYPNARALTQIVCDNGSSTTLNYPRQSWASFNAGSSTSCYARFRITPNVVPARWGSQYRITWTRSGGWGYGYYA